MKQGKEKGGRSAALLFTLLYSADHLATEYP